MTPSVVMTAGPPGSGKSVDLAATGARDWFFFGPPGGLRVDTSVLGISLEGRRAYVHIMEEVIRALPWVKEQGYKGVGVDDATVLLTASMTRARESYASLKQVQHGTHDEMGRLLPGIIAGADGRFYVNKGYDRALWGYHEGLVVEFAETCRNLELHAAITGHVQEPYKDNKTGARCRGGMDVAWKKLTPKLIYIADLVQMTTPWPDTADWDRRVVADGNHPDFALKDRHHILPASGGPLNTAEVLRAYGHVIGRPVGLEWIDDFAEGGVAKILAGTPEEEVIKSAAVYLQGQNVLLPHARWAIRDTIHRARLRVHAAQGWGRL